MTEQDEKQTHYGSLGVDSNKKDVHAAIQNLDQGLFPKAFCKVIEDYLSGSPEHCLILHSDGAGTKSSLAYIYWKETGDISVLRGLAQDAIVMNLDDILCTGYCDTFIVSQILGRNKFNMPGPAIAEIINGVTDFIEKMKPYGINIVFAGGETADIGDLVRTSTVDMSMIARLRRKDVIECKIKPGQVILGLFSDGKAVYEDEENSGILSNGFTSGRHGVFSGIYREIYPESFDTQNIYHLAYKGSRHLTDKYKKLKNIGKAMLSPTRTFAPLLIKMLQEGRDGIGAIIHCTGGGATKVLNFAPDGVVIIKDNMPKPGDIFNLIQTEADIPLEEMYKNFNMRIGMEIYCDKDQMSKITEMAKEFNIDSQIIGRVVEGDSSSKASLVIKREGQTLEYSA